jgi:hypothetical protein
MEGAQEVPSGAQIRTVVASVAVEGDVRGLRIIARDIDEPTFALAPHEREGRDATLQRRLEVGNEAEDAEMSPLARRRPSAGAWQA